MKKITILLVLLISMVSYSQKCRYKTNKLDKFTKELKKITKLKNIYKSFGSSLSLDAGNVGGRIFIGLNLLRAGGFYIPEGNKVSINIGSEVIELNYNMTTDTDIKTIPPTGAIRYRVYGRCYVDAVKYQKLLKSKTHDIRIYAGNGYVDFKIKKRKLDILPNLLKCVQ